MEEQAKEYGHSFLRDEISSWFDKTGFSIIAIG